MASSLTPTRRGVPRVVSVESDFSSPTYNSVNAASQANESFLIQSSIVAPSNTRKLQGKALITKPRPNDVLCGRGSAVNTHAGNQRFRHFLDKYHAHYQDSSKSDKSNLALQLVLHLQTQTTPPTRFLARLPASEIPAGFDKSTAFWYERDALKASKKVSQRLRECKKQLPSSLKAIKRSQKKTQQASLESSLPDLATSPECEPIAAISGYQSFMEIASPEVTCSNTINENSTFAWSHTTANSSGIMGINREYAPPVLICDDVDHNLPMPTAAELVQDLCANDFDYGI